MFETETSHGLHSAWNPAQDCQHARRAMGARTGRSARFGRVSVRTGKAKLRHVAHDHPAVHAPVRRGVRVTTWREYPGSGVVVALWPDEKHLLEADEGGATRALVAVT